MRHFPRQIEADLLFRGVDIYDWHQGQMCSARLIACIEALPDDSAYWKERRDGDWSDDQYMTAIIVNELRLGRVDQVAMRGGKMELELLKSPAQTLDDEQMKTRRDDARKDVLRQLKGGQGG